MRFSRENIKQGLLNQQASVETPDSFATIDGASVPGQGMELSSANQRMAGKQGARALAMMNNPMEKERTDGWMRMFGLSNQGMDFNRAKALMSAPPATAQSKPQETNKAPSQKPQQKMQEQKPKPTQKPSNGIKTNIQSS